jgi:4-hydroxybenzoate polyprenyltransferase
MENLIFYIVGIVLLILLLRAMWKRYCETRDDALAKGHRKGASVGRGLAYVAMALLSIAFFLFVLFNLKTLGLWGLLLIGLVPGVAWSLFAKWAFDKNPKNKKSQSNSEN